MWSGCLASPAVKQLNIFQYLWHPPLHRNLPQRDGHGCPFSFPSYRLSSYSVHSLVCQPLVFYPVNPFHWLSPDISTLYHALIHLHNWSALSYPNHLGTTLTLFIHFMVDLCCYTLTKICIHSHIFVSHSKHLQSIMLHSCNHCTGTHPMVSQIYSNWNILIHATCQNHP